MITYAVPHINITILNNRISFKFLIKSDSENNMAIMKSPTAGIWKILADDDNGKNNISLNDNKSYSENQLQKKINGKQCEI